MNFVALETKILNGKEQKQKKIAFILAIICIFLIFIDYLIISLIYSWTDWIALLIFSLLYIVPAYLANAGMVLVGGGKPIDGGKNFIDGRPIFGPGKTWNGLIKGPLYIGIPISAAIFLLFIMLWGIIEPIPSIAIENEIYQYYNNMDYYRYYFIGGRSGDNLLFGFLTLLIRIILCAYGAVFGDLIGSFIKRRLNLNRGQPLWIIDQLDFAIFAMILTSIPSLIIPEIFLPIDILIISFLLILTPSVAIFANTIAFLLGLKNVPW
jgi:CDP-2,3-bis-(O-geranylgeranyl)-sn-glycerol synthase